MIVNQINSYLRRQGSPLAPHAGAFVQAGQRYGVDPRFLVAIAGSETSFGKYGPSQRIHNPFGWGPHIRFNSYPEAINTIAKGLATGPHYKTKGRTTIPQIGATWAPVGAANDPTNLNTNWSKNVSKFYADQGGNPNAPVFTGQSPATGGHGHDPRPPAQAQAGLAPVAPTVNPSALLGLIRQQTQRALAGQMPTANFGRQLQAMAGQFAQRASTVQQGGGQAVVPPATGLSTDGFTSGGFEARGGPHAGSHTLGNWQSDNAWDLFAGAGAPVHFPTSGRIVKISPPGNGPRFAGHGVTIQTPRGNVFVKHIDANPRLRVEQQVRPGTFLGGLTASTAGGPHIHLGAEQTAMLNWLRDQYSGRS